MALAAVPAIPALASTEADPIFAALEKYRASSAAFFARCSYENRLEESGDEYGELLSAPGDYRTPEMVALVTADIADREALARTAPTTHAGLVACSN
jgi:hypothetical protein